MKHGQKEMKPTDWSEAWLQYQDFVTNSPWRLPTSCTGSGMTPTKREGKKKIGSI